MSTWHGLVYGAKEGSEGMRSGLVPATYGFFSDWNKSGLHPALKNFGLKKSFHSAWEMSFKGSLMFNLPIAAFSAATAPRGRMFSTGVGNLATGFGSAVGGLLAGTPGALLGGFLADQFISDKIGTAVQYVKDFDSNSRRMHFGGDYVDTEAAYTMRQAAAREMAGSLMNARQWLGKEGAYLHS